MEEIYGTYHMISDDFYPAQLVHSINHTLPETNSSPLTINGWKTTFLLEW